MQKGATNRQIFFILFITLTSVSLIKIPNTMATSAGVGSWLTILIVSIIFAFITAVIIKLNLIYKDKALYDYSKEIVGKTGSILLSIYYFLYFIIIYSFLCISLVDIINSKFLIKTPEWAILFTSISVCSYGAYKGITNIARLYELFGVIFLIGVIGTHALMFFQGDIQEILPFFIKSDVKTYISSIDKAIIPFLGIEVLTIIPLNNNNKKIIKKGIITILFVGLIYILAIETTIMMIGMNEIAFRDNSVIAAIRLVELPFIDFIRRIDIVYLIIGLMSIHIGTILSNVSSVNYLHNIFKIKRYIIVIIIGIITFILTLIAVNVRDIDEILNKYIIYFGLISAAFIPSILLFLAKVKKNETNYS